MAVIRVEKNKNYTVMSNVHLRDETLTLKAKGLLSLILSLPDDWHYSINGLATLTKEGRAGVMSCLKELEAAGYITRHQLRGEHGRMGQNEYVIYEEPRPPQSGNPTTVKPTTEKPYTEEPTAETRTQLSTEEQITEKQNTDSSKYRFNSFQDAAEVSAEEMRKEREQYRQLILRNIEYDILCQDRKLRQDDLDEIVEIMVDTVCANKPSSVLACSSV